MTFAEKWTGASWVLQFTAVPAGAAQSALTGVSCVPGGCAAVGTYTGPSGIGVTLAERAPA